MATALPFWTNESYRRFVRDTEFLRQHQSPSGAAAGTLDVRATMPLHLLARLVQ